MMLFASLAIIAQQRTQKDSNTLLWEISGNGLQKPSYLFGTIHMICADEAMLSDSLKSFISQVDVVYMEVDMDNFMEMLGVLRKMKMRNDTTLADLLTKQEYQKVKDYFEAKGSMIPFSVLETYKPMLAASMLAESNTNCPKSAAMEEVIIKEAKLNSKKIKGLETMSYQMSIFDSIPYQLQAKQLLKYVEDGEKGKDDSKEYDVLVQAYRDQDLQKLEEITKLTNIGMQNFTDILLYNRNRNWVEKLKYILPEKSVLVAVGAGHLPGENGLINLLRKAGYTVKPVGNKIKRGVEI